MERFVNAGTRFFHSTTYESAFSILSEGLKPSVNNQWGGGEFGPGFYTATTRDGAALYRNPPQVVIEFSAKEKLNGIAMNPTPNWNQEDPALKKYCAEYDFITNMDSAPLEYKFNHRSYGKLKIEAVHIWHTNSWINYTPQKGLEYLHNLTK